MKRAIGYQLSAISLIFSCWTVCYAQPLSSTELINKAKEYDGKSVVYAGEAIGDVMVRGDFVWVNLNDGENAIGVWLDKELAKEIKYTGSYQAKGDRLEVTGVFHRVCIQHGGDMDIHAQNIRKISPGKLVEEKLDTVKRNFTFILLGILFLVLIFVRRQGSRLNKSKINPASTTW
jgi:hypothetical protein